MKKIHNFSPGKINFCQVCNSENIHEVLDLGHQPPCDNLLNLEDLDKKEISYPLKAKFCESCALVQISHLVDDKELYYKDYPYLSGITSELVLHLNRLSIDMCHRFKISEKDLVIDIGSNDGTLLKGFKKQGCNVLGIEPTNVAKIAQNKGIPTLQEFFSKKIALDIKKEHKNIKLITATNMFAHMSNLGDFIEGVLELMDDESIFLIENHYLLEIIKQLQFDSFYHEHLRSYSLISLKKLFDYYNLKIIDAYPVASYGGSIRVMISKNKNIKSSSNVDFQIKEELKFGLNKYETMLNFKKKTYEAKYKILDLAFNCKKNGLQFVGNSCSGRASTLVNFIGLTKDLMPYIAEQPTSLKLNKFLPGTHNPIVDNQIIIDEQPDYVLLLAWHYSENISKYLIDKGYKGKLVTPLPEIKIN